MLNYSKLQKLDEILEETVKSGATCALSAALVTKDCQWMKFYGNRQVTPSEEANDFDTIFDLASISKVLVTTTCILKLKEEGLLLLETKIADILSDFKEKEITIKQCITHSSGLPADIDGYKLMSRDEMIEAAMKIQKDPQWIGKVHYSDVNFILLGMVVAKLKGSLDGYAKEVMFEPLKMINTTYNPSEELKDRCAAYEWIENRGGVIRGVVHDGKAYKLGGVSGHAGVFTTLEDITHYVQMLLNDGIYQGKRFFSKDTMELLKHSQTEGMNERRSIGWIISDGNYALGKNFSDRTLYHTGFSGPSMVIDFKRQMGCIVLANRVHPSRENKLILSARNTIHDAAYACVEGE